ncbi:MAG: hypothetical protein ACI3XY_05870 [Butyricicoccaceae bacterium]
MRNIFIGFFLIFLDLNLTFDTSVLGLLPDFVGYLFLLRGLKELEGSSTRFVQIRPFVIGMVIYSAVIYVLDLLGISVQLDWLGLLIGIVGTVVSLYISYVVIQGVREMETGYGVDLNGQQLESLWKIMAIVQMLVYVGAFLPILLILFAIVGVVLSILFLIAWNHARKQYEALPPQTFSGT